MTGAAGMKTSAHALNCIHAVLWAVHSRANEISVADMYVVAEALRQAAIEIEEMARRREWEEMTTPPNLG